MKTILLIISLFLAQPALADGLKILQPQVVIAAGAMTGTAVVTSPAIYIGTITSATFVASWTGTPTGVISVRGSVDYGLVGAGAAKWVDMGITVTNPAGSSGVALVDITRTGLPFIQFVYTNASGAGTLYVTASGKGL